MAEIYPDTLFDLPDYNFIREARFANYESEKDEENERALIEVGEMEKQARKLMKRIRALKSKKSTSNKAMDWFLKKN